MALVRIARNAVTARVLEPDRSVLTFVTNLLSYQVEAGFRGTGWDGTSSFFSPTRHTFPAGFTHLVCEELRKVGHQVHLIEKPAPEPLGPEDPVVDGFGNADPRYDYQMQALRQVEKHGAGIIRAATGCHAAGTGILMFDGSIKKVEDVVAGDRLMGPDSKPRTVLELHRGRDRMYEIKPARGRPFIVNKGHILSLENRRFRGQAGGEWVNISVEDYLSRSPHFRKHHQLHYSRGVDFEGAELPLDPYLVGALIGDGAITKSTPLIGTCDPEIEHEITRIVTRMGLETTVHERVTSGGKVFRQMSLVNWTWKNNGGINSIVGRRNLIGSKLAELGLRGCTSKTKFIPHVYKTASRVDRLRLLAGIIDTDGYLDAGYYSVATVNLALAQDVAFVARSLGFRATVNTKIQTGTWVGDPLHIVSITGDISTVPVQVERKKISRCAPRTAAHSCGFDVIEIGDGDYFGFEVDGDNLYLLDDFLVTHNSGKSRICHFILARYRRPSLFLTTRGILAYQMMDRLKAGGMNVGMIGDGTMKAVRGVNIAMVQTLVAALEEPHLDVEIRKLVAALHGSKTRDATAVGRDEIEAQAREIVERKTRRRNAILKFLEMVEVVIGEEAHEAGGDSYFRILQHCTSAKIRVALTATPFMRDSAEDNMRLMAAFGPILIDISEQMLIERGILAQPVFKLVDAPAPPRLHRTSPFERAYKLGYVENPALHALIVKDAARAASLKLPVLCLVARKNHGEALKAAYAAAGLRAVFLRGEDDMAERRAKLADLVKGKLDVVIGTTILDVGVDVPAIGLVQLAGGMKAEVAMRQRIGRGLRAKKTGPNVAFVADYSCNANHTLKDHARQRENIIRRTPGFAENLLPAGQDFPWEIFA